ncbi:MAG: thiamine pyrophosphate-binding protein [Gemmatimonadaceae bacterium]
MSSWPLEVHRVLHDEAVRQIAFVPDAGLSHLIELCEADGAMQLVRLTTEEEGVALLAGAWLGGEKGVLLMQSSGTGNCINMLSLTKGSRFPLLMLVTMRGEDGETNPAQVPMGSATQQVLEAIGANVVRAESSEQIAQHVSSAVKRAYATNSSEAVLIAQHVLGFKAFK